MAKFKKLPLAKTYRGKTIYRRLLLSDKPTSVLTKYTPSRYERLDSISHRFYGDPKYWYVIAHANNIADGKFHAPDGQELIIPQI